MTAALIAAGRIFRFASICTSSIFFNVRPASLADVSGRALSNSCAAAAVAGDGFRARRRGCSLIFGGFYGHEEIVSQARREEELGPKG